MSSYAKYVSWRKSEKYTVQPLVLLLISTTPFVRCSRLLREWESTTFIQLNFYFMLRLHPFLGLLLMPADAIAILTPLLCILAVAVKVKGLLWLSSSSLCCLLSVRWKQGGGQTWMCPKKRRGSSSLENQTAQLIKKGDQKPGPENL